MAQDFHDDTYECDDYESGSYDNGYEWTEEDSWDALTDGMYGECPKDPLMWDLMQDIMGY